MMLTSATENAQDCHTEDCIRGGTEQGAIPDGKRVPARAEAQDLVDETSLESFPASDPPSWTPTTSLGPPPAVPAG